MPTITVQVSGRATSEPVLCPARTLALGTFDRLTLGRCMEDDVGQCLGNKRFIEIDFVPYGGVLIGLFLNAPKF